MNREELRKYIGITGYSLGQVEKDYFQHMILGALSRKFSETLVFKGGTALQKLGIIPRFSEDLDFTLKKELKIQKMRETIENIIQNYNYIVELDNFIDDERTIGFRIKIQGLLYRNRMGICTVRIEASKREQVILEPDKKEFAPPYTDILPYIMSVMQNNEILAEKVRTIYTRHKARDLYDIYNVINIGTKFDIKLVNKKLEYYDLKFDANTFINNCKKLEPNWDSELKSLLDRVVPYREVMKVIKEMLN